MTWGKKILVILVICLLVLILYLLVNLLVMKEEAKKAAEELLPPETSPFAKVVLSGTPKITLSGSPYVSLDRPMIEDVEITLRNIGSGPAEIYRLALTVGDEECSSPLYEAGEKIAVYTSYTLGPGKEKTFRMYCGVGMPLTRKIGVYTFTGTLKVLDFYYNIISEQNLTISLPTLRVGGTVPEVEGTTNMSLTLLRWIEGHKAVRGPYVDGYYTFTAKPGMKFVILIYELKNNWYRPQKTPYIDSGEIGTDAGHIFPYWEPPLGIHSEEYKPRKATEEEIKTLIGTSGSWKDLLPGESTVGCAVFEIPEDEEPVEASLAHVDHIIVLGPKP